LLIIIGGSFSVRYCCSSYAKKPLRRTSLGGGLKTTPLYGRNIFLIFPRVVRIIAYNYIRNNGALEMNTKLTLKLNKRSIDSAKKYAQKNKKSLSVLVENYFNLIAEKDNTDKIEISPNVLELSGIIELSEDMNLKEVYGKHLDEKYSK